MPPLAFPLTLMSRAMFPISVRMFSLFHYCTLGGESKEGFVQFFTLLTSM